MSIGNWSAFYTPFNETIVKKYVPTSAGLYALWVNYKSGKWGCFYVGKAEDLEERLLGHLSDKEQNNCIKENVKYRCGFHWIEVTTESERSGAEKYLYDTIKPDCNKNDPGGKPVRISLPPTPPPTSPTK